MADEIAEEMDDNEALRRLLGEFREWRRESVGEYDSVATVTGTAKETGDVRVERAANASAVKTVIVNSGDYRVYVYEDGVLVSTIGSKADDEIPLQGKGAISVACLTGGATGTTVAITTYIRE